MLTFNLYNFISNSLLGGLIILIILALKKSLFKKLSNKFNYFVWIPLLICTMLPIRINISDDSLTKSAHYLKSFYLNMTTDNFLETRSFFFWDSLLYIHILISILYFSSYILNFIFDRKEILMYSFEIKNEHINRIYNKAADELGIKKRPSLKVCDCISTPINIGVINSNIVIPNINYSDVELELIFKHEFIHGKRHDFFIKAFAQLAVSFNWFNPLFYIMKNDILAWCELSCDEAVMKLSPKSCAKEYGYMILKTSNNMYERDYSLFSALSSVSSVKNRIYSILDSKKKYKGNIFLFVLSILFIWIFLNASIKIYSIPNIVNAYYFNENQVSSSYDSYGDYLFNTIAGFLNNSDITGLESFLQENNIDYNIKNDSLIIDNEQVSVNLNLSSPTNYIVRQK